MFMKRASRRRIKARVRLYGWVSKPVLWEYDLPLPKGWVRDPRGLEIWWSPDKLPDFLEKMQRFIAAERTLWEEISHSNL